MNSLIISLRRPIILFVHLLLITSSYYLTFVLRLDFVSFFQFKTIFLKTLPLLIAVRLIFFVFFHILSGWWRYVSIKDLINIILAVTVSSLVFGVLIYFLFGLEGYPRSVLIIDWFICIFFVGGIRLTIRFIRESVRPEVSERDKNLLIVGAGDAGAMLLKEIQSNPLLTYNPVGFVDDDEQKHGFRIHGVKVLGKIEQIPEIQDRYNIEEVIIAIPSATGRQIRRVIEHCKKTNISFEILPSVTDWIKNKPALSQIKKVDLEDLLGREQIILDKNLIQNSIKGSSVLITGAAGSIGSELARQAAQYEPQKLILFDRNENNLYFTELTLRKLFPKLKIFLVIGDILDESRMEEVFSLYRPSIIYHAAAFKHVPLMEANVIEAVKNNIFGTENVVNAALKYNAKKFVLISTDKAINPSSVMGVTKRVAELIVQEVSCPDTISFVSVRFGNVLGSDGSVIPIFKKQLAEGGPITVTDKEATRYFMTIPEAVQLVMQAGVIGNSGDIMLLDMGEPVKIDLLAKNLIKLSGLEPDKDIAIIYTGLRPGEKLHEELYWSCEGSVLTVHKKIKVLRAINASRNDLKNKISNLRKLADGRREEDVLNLIKLLVPEFKHIKG